MPFSPGRNGQTPQISLSYNSGGGNSVFGLGWGVGIPNIQRKTEKELPKYEDENESDTFILSGAEDLVPELVEENGDLIPYKKITGNTIVRRYRPRIEGLFSRIEKIEDNGNVYWKTISKENVVSVFGEVSDARVSNPKRPKQIFRWNLEYSYDDKGHFTRYVYKPEDSKGIGEFVFDKNRVNDNAAFANLYLKRVLYGNQIAWYRDSNNAQPKTSNDFLFELVFDYGEHNAAKPIPNESKDWDLREDSFSTYRSGFEIRTQRFCKRILMFHRFDELSPNPYLVRSLDLEYETNSNFSYLTSVQQSGYIWTAGGNLKSKQSLPPMKFEYLKNKQSHEVKKIVKKDLHSWPSGFADNQYQWIDLYSEGLNGILSEYGDGWYYKSNLGNGNFSPATLVTPKPSYEGIQDGSLTIQELEGNGEKYLVHNHRNGGYFALDSCEGWQSLRTFEQFPNINLDDPNLKFLDLNGDGLPDIAISMENEFIWYPGKGKIGYDDYLTAGRASNDELGPQVLFSDSNQNLLIATADMSGDGLSDIVLIQNQSVCYYPNLGYGRFGAKVSMQFKSHFDRELDFKTQHIYLADIDGSGTTDIIYTGKNHIHVYYNQSGNSLELTDQIFNPFPNINSAIRLNILDLLGTGTSCIVWSSPLPADRSHPLQYIDLTDGQKPHVMTSYYNNMGKVVSVNYKPSTHYFLKDKKQGIDWVSKLPFPVQCVDKVVTQDRISETKFTSEYSYHHGYYDGIEREFRGFAKVVTRDLESFGNYESPDHATTPQSNPLDQDTVVTKSWFHTGYSKCRDYRIHLLEEEYYKYESNPDINYKVDSTKLPEGLKSNELNEAYRALKSLPLRQEVYSEAGTADERIHPYMVVQNNYYVQKIQYRGDNKYSVFQSIEKENLSFNLERNPDDPRISHKLNLELNPFGQILKSASIVYGRKLQDSTLQSNKDREQQSKIHIVFSSNEFTHEIDNDQDFRWPNPCGSDNHELALDNPIGEYYSKAELLDGFTQASSLDYHASVQKGEKRLIERSRILFLRNALNGSLPYGNMESRALSYQNYLLAFAPTMISDTYGSKASDHQLRNEANYVRFEGDDNYWVRSGITHFHPDTNSNPNINFVLPATAQDLTFAKANFFLPVVYEDPIGNLTKMVYDSNKIFAQKSIDAIGNTFEISEFHYRTLSPWLLIDINKNRSAVRYNALGLPVAMFVMGVVGELLGDKMHLSTIEVYSGDKPSVLMNYEFDRYESSNPNNLDPSDPLYPTILPNRVYSQAFENHYYDMSGQVQTQTKKQEKYTYSDGSGNIVMEKVNAEDGLVKKLDSTGSLIEANSADRWVGTGKTILNNKGNTIKQYEPFFDDNPEFTFEEAILCQGYSPTIRYDALGRMYRTDNADGTYRYIEFDNWHQKHYDENDNVLNSQWYYDNTKPAASDAEKLAAEKTKIHADTPTIAHLDSLGRVFLTLDHNKGNRKNESVFETWNETRVNYDLESNPLKVIDARGNLVMCWKYNMLGHQVWQRSMDGGERWILADALQREYKSWDSRGHVLLVKHDKLNRPTEKSFEKDGNQTIYEKYIYGETSVNATANNLNGQLTQLYDTAGSIKNIQFDFKGNLLKSDRSFCLDYKNIPNWPISNPGSLLETTSPYESLINYDALNRVIEKTTAYNSIQSITYNKAGLLEKVEVDVKGEGNIEMVIKNINYNAKGQRKLIEYGNNTITEYEYYNKNYRLKHLKTRRGLSRILQDLNYTYDPVGNITEVYDNAQKTKFYKGQRIDQRNQYTYDALYQLIEANGREHRGQVGYGPKDNWNDSWSQNELQVNNDMNLRNYTQKYFYDQVGNILQLKHHVQSSSYKWTRNYQYHNNNNQLLGTIVGDGSNHPYLYSYNEHGSIQKLSHFDENILWNFREEMQAISISDTKKAYYVYDNAGQRVRKIVENNGIKKERRYLDGVEVYEESTITGPQLRRESLSINDDTGRVCLIETKTLDLSGSSGTHLYRYQYSNHLSTVSLELNKRGTPISYEEYHPFGTSSYRAVNKNINGEAKRYRYTSKERDEESGLYYHGARYYVSWIGRWLKVDPAGLVDSCNLYKYSKNSPVNYKDSNGYRPSKSDVEKKARNLAIKALVDQFKTSEGETKKEKYLSHARLVSYGMEADSLKEHAQDLSDRIVDYFNPPKKKAKKQNPETFLGGDFLRMYLDGKIDTDVIDQAGEEMKEHDTFKSLESGLQTHLQKHLKNSNYSDERLLNLANQYLKNRLDNSIYFRNGLNTIVGGLSGIEAKNITYSVNETDSGIEIKYNVTVEFSDVYDFENDRSGVYDKYRKSLAKMLKEGKFAEFEKAYAEQAITNSKKISRAGVFASFMYALEKAGYTPGSLEWSTELNMSGTINLPKPKKN